MGDVGEGGGCGGGGDGVGVVGEALRMFTSQHAAPITLGDYIKRIVFYTRTVASPVCIAGALLYVERLEQRRLLSVTPENALRLFSTCFLVAYKSIEDAPHMSNAKYAKIAGLPTVEVNSLELALALALDFDVGFLTDETTQRAIANILVPPRSPNSSAIFWRLPPSPSPSLTNSVSPDLLEVGSEDREQTPDSVIAFVAKESSSSSSSSSISSSSSSSSSV